MPRRPDRTWAILLAGLICLVVFISEQGWSREEIGAPVRLGEAGGTQVAQVSHLISWRPVLAGSQLRPEGAAASSSSRQTWGYQWLTGGFLGSLLCHFVYGYPLRYVWQEGLWPPGLLDLLALMTMGYLGYRLYREGRRGTQPSDSDAPPRFLQLDKDTPPVVAVWEEAKPGLDAIRETDQDFDIRTFGEETRKMLLEVYSAWNREDVSSLYGRVRESLLEYLQMGLKILSLREECSHLEDLILENITITAARVDDGKEFITVCFRGRLLDYVLDRPSGKLLLGSLAYPASFQELWDLERPRGQTVWVLQDIRDM